jgi:hypothetical protein
MTTRVPSESERERIRKYLSLDEESLYSLLPLYLDEYAGTAFSPEGQQEAGRSAFRQRRARIHQSLCRDWQLCRKIDHPAFTDTINLVVVVGDAIATAVSGIPPILVASLLVKIGLRSFCGCQPRKE